MKESKTLELLFDIFSNSFVEYQNIGNKTLLGYIGELKSEFDDKAMISHLSTLLCKANENRRETTIMLHHELDTKKQEYNALKKRLSRCEANNNIRYPKVQIQKPISKRNSMKDIVITKSMESFIKNIDMNDSWYNIREQFNNKFKCNLSLNLVRLLVRKINIKVI